MTKKKPAPADPIATRLADAHAHCAARGTQLTAQRQEVLELLLRREGPAKAYDLQEDMQARHGRVAPTTIYRALEFLTDNGLVHRVDALNAFIACSADHDHHHVLMVVCSNCQRTEEIADDALYRAIRTRLAQAQPGFHDEAIEIKGVCAACAAAAPSKLHAHAG